MFDKPTPEQFADEDGYIDYYEYDMALDQWRSQFPDLHERWCGELKPEPVEELPSFADMLFAAFAPR